MTWVRKYLSLMKWAFSSTVWGILDWWGWERGGGIFLGNSKGGWGAGWEHVREWAPGSKQNKEDGGEGLVMKTDILVSVMGYPMSHPPATTTTPTVG